MRVLRLGIFIHIKSFATFAPKKHPGNWVRYLFPPTVRFPESLLNDINDSTEPRSSPVSIRSFPLLMLIYNSSVISTSYVLLGYHPVYPSGSILVWVLIHFLILSLNSSSEPPALRALIISALLLRGSYCFFFLTGATGTSSLPVDAASAGISTVGLSSAWAWAFILSILLKYPASLIFCVFFIIYLLGIFTILGFTDSFKLFKKSSWVISIFPP